VRYYPLFLDIAGRRCCVVGGGQVAERKAERLLECGAAVEIVSRELTEPLARLKALGKIRHQAADYEEALIRGAFLVIGATDNQAVNGRIAADARRLGILVNIVDDPGLCDFILPSLVTRGDLAIAVSTGGRSPALAKRLRRELEEAYGPEYGELTEILGALRRKVLAAGEGTPNQAKFQAVVDSSILELIRAKRWPEVEQLLKALTGIEMEVKAK
jgi:precorrin-2 dehydrogenase/sirohydrochlorin ferrochelatase